MITNLGHFRRHEPDNPPLGDALYFKNERNEDFYELQEQIEGACFLLAEPETNKIVDHSTDIATLSPFNHHLLSSDEALELDTTQDWYFTGQAIRVRGATLDELKVGKISELTAAFNADLNAGFDSDALGRTHRYDSEVHNRENLIGAVATGIAQMFTCLPVRPRTQTGDDGQGNADSKQQRQHTPEQLKQVLIDGAAVKQALIARLRAKRTAVLAATSEDEVNAISWESA